MENQRQIGGEVPAGRDLLALGRRIHPGVMLLANLILVGAWAWYFRPIYAYFDEIFSHVEFRTNQIVLAAAAALLLHKIYKAKPGLRALAVAAAPPRPSPTGLALIASGVLGFLLAERFLDINTVSAVLFALASYGLLGLWMDPARWRKGIPAALLVIGFLPFGVHMETFAGYPLRLVTAQGVRSLLGGLGFHSVGVDTILVFESGVSQVDIPCSGIKSLWTGALFLLAATWIEERPLNLRWLLAGIATALLLVVSNFIRVALLALTGPALGYPILAEMLHLPLGVLGFCAACAAGLWVLKGGKLGTASRETRAPAALKLAPWLSPVLALSVLALSLAVPQRAAQSAGSADALQWTFPAALSVTPAPLTAQELDWIREGGAEGAERFTFHWQSGGQPLTGTFMLLTSQDWRGQHQPERCFQVFGFTVRESYTTLAAQDFPLRYLSLAHPALTGRSLAAYWLQSPSQTTDDYAQRIWADLSPSRERWVLVTVLFDQPTDADSPALAPFFHTLRDAVDRSLSEGGVP